MRELTGSTRIRVRAPRKAPARKPLTGDTRIRLSQIKDLAAWIEDRRYEIGQISTKTGLMKTANGWIVPPHSMAPEPQESIENSHRIGGGANYDDDKAYRTDVTERHRSAKTNAEEDREPFRTKREIQLTVEDDPENIGWKIKAKQQVIDVVSFARGIGIDDIKRLMDTYLANGKRTREDDWEKCKGNTPVTRNNKERDAHVHWYQAKDVGKVEFKIVDWQHIKNQKR